MEIIHVQLPLERTEVIMLEVSGKNVVAELYKLLDDKAVALLGPLHHFVCVLRVNNIVQLKQKGRNIENTFFIYVHFSELLFILLKIFTIL